MSTTTLPIIGTSRINRVQPLRFVSCSRRMLTARLGTTNESHTTSDTRELCRSASTTPPAALTISTKSTHHQYSARDARPWVDEYCAHPLRTAPVKLISVFS